jgi:hypothetical protein
MTTFLSIEQWRKVVSVFKKRNNKAKPSVDNCWCSICNGLVDQINLPDWFPPHWRGHDVNEARFVGYEKRLAIGRMRLSNRPSLIYEALRDYYPQIMRIIETQQEEIMEFLVNNQQLVLEPRQWWRLAQKELVNITFYKPAEPHIGRTEFYGILHAAANLKIVKLRYNTNDEYWKIFPWKKRRLVKTYRRFETFFIALYYKALDISYKIRIFW